MRKSATDEATVVCMDTCTCSRLGWCWWWAAAVATFDCASAAAKHVCPIDSDAGRRAPIPYWHEQISVQISITLSHHLLNSLSFTLSSIECSSSIEKTTALSLSPVHEWPPPRFPSIRQSTVKVFLSSRTTNTIEVISPARGWPTPPPAQFINRKDCY